MGSIISFSQQYDAADDATVNSVSQLTPTHIRQTALWRWRSFLTSYSKEEEKPCHLSLFEQTFYTSFRFTNETGALCTLQEAYSKEGTPARPGSDLSWRELTPHL